ncbi:hypothetical protein JDV02_010687 [Purpureocillium takamizusanense]|uniref:Uncharacterized protein n=1 Tax=Purpureocillium takamizusanense TaxID=2060973 RepID=A0A9Q8QUG9_9HYPO|nr:uncharacterized protein JDV02_010687 [Purpureocillium takamizusanense]UNI24974.1 hypothetical protein JDV02_010687 [Purpureocillium takamizusanense]
MPTTHNETLAAQDEPQPLAPVAEVAIELNEDLKGFEAHERLFQAIDPQEEKKLVRKIDMVILPIMAFVYLFQYVDKNSINNAAVFGLRKDCALNGVQFSWVVSLFYFGQLVSEYPAAYLLSRFRVATFIGATVVDTTTAWFLNARERDLATRRLAIDRSTRERSEFNKAQMWEALRSPLTWFYFAFAICVMLTAPILKVCYQARPF